jgi:hypothetical protein
MVPESIPPECTHGWSNDDWVNVAVPTLIGSRQVDPILEPSWNTPEVDVDLVTNVGVNSRWLKPCAAYRNLEEDCLDDTVRAGTTTLWSMSTAIPGLSSQTM